MSLPKVLVVDDDPDVLDVIRVKLQKVGIATDGADSAEQALSLMRQNLYIAAVADIHMPGQSGAAMVSAFKEISPLVQVIMLTADASMSRVIDCVDRGAVDFFSKNDEPALLVEAVANAIQRGVRWRSWIGHRMTPAPIGG